MERLLLVFIFLVSSIFPVASAQADSGYAVPVSSDLDRKEYRGLILDNGLKVLLVSDPESDRAEASMDVHVGSGSDPEGWNGLAHFLEHMLFLGTGKYPDAGEYQAFIKNHGGTHNAYTSYDHTNYFFYVNHDSLEPALDRFSRFFIDPTFEERYVEREREIVDSEYQALRREEGRRIWETQKEILNPGHPASRFSVGSRQTLGDKDGITVRERLIRFYEQWYSADIMSLALVGREPLDTLEDWVREKFSAIPDRDVTPPVYIQSYLNRDLAPVRLDIVPNKHVNQVWFQWAIPSVEDKYLSKPLGYISNLLGHEGEGSLLAELKKRGWAESLSAGGGFMDRHQGTLLISIGLTESGIDHIAEIGELLFRYIALVRDSGIEEWRFEEQQRLGEKGFRFEEERGGGTLARSLSSRMQYYPFKDLLRGPYIVEHFDPETVRTILDHLVPEKTYLQIVSRLHRVRRVSRWYGVRHGISSIESDWIERWQHAEGTDFEGLHLPEPNPFIPQRLAVTELEEVHELPEKLDTAYPISAWYQGDQEFKLPKASFFASLKSPLASSTPQNAVLTELWVHLLNDQLNSVSYPAQLAGVSYSLYQHTRGVSLRINGFQDKQSKLLQIIMDRIRQSSFTEERLEIARHNLSRMIGNRNLDRPSDQTVRALYQLVIDPYWTDNERLTVLSGITLEDVHHHAESFLRHLSVVSLAHGDLTEEDATSLNRQVLDTFSGIQEEVPVDHPRIRRLGYEKPNLRTMQVEHDDTSLSYYFQGEEKSYQALARSRLLGQLIEAPFYQEMRTENSLGYLVFASSFNLLEVPGLMLSIQSSTHNASEIDALVQDFLSDFPQHLMNMGDEAFLKARKGLVAGILAREKNLSDRSGRYWTEIDLKEYDFDSRNQLADAVRVLTREDMIFHVRNLFSLKPRIIKVQSPGRRKGADEGALDVDGYFQTGDPSQFRKSAISFFPS